jgi:hypothetical protein
MKERSSKYVKDVGGNDNIKETPGGYFYQRESENDPWVRISAAEYKERFKQGGHLLDINLAEKLYNKIPGPKSEKRLAALRDILNEGGTNLRSKTSHGNQSTDKVPEIHFNKFFDGTWSETELRDEWTRGHSAKLAQYRHFLAKTEGDDRLGAAFRKRFEAFVSLLESIDKYGSPSTRTPARDSGLRLDGEPDRRTRIGRDLEEKGTQRESTRTPARDSGLRLDGEPDRRTRIGRDLEAKATQGDPSQPVEAPTSSPPPARITGLRLDGAPDMRTKIGRELRIGRELEERSSPPPARITGLRLDGAPDMRTKIGRESSGMRGDGTGMHHHHQAQEQQHQHQQQQQMMMQMMMQQQQQHMPQHHMQHMQQFHHQQLFHQHTGSVGDMGGMSSMGGTPDLSTRHTGPRAADGSLDMRFAANRGHDKWLD